MYVVLVVTHVVGPTSRSRRWCICLLYESSRVWAGRGAGVAGVGIHDDKQTSHIRGCFSAWSRVSRASRASRGSRTLQPLFPGVWRSSRLNSARSWVMTALMPLLYSRRPMIHSQLLHRISIIITFHRSPPSSQAETLILKQ